jgi:hypothetical protein
MPDRKDLNPVSRRPPFSGCNRDLFLPVFNFKFKCNPNRMPSVDTHRDHNLRGKCLHQGAKVV